MGSWKQSRYAILKDLADVQELIRQKPLPKSFAEQLNPWVREKFAELWTATRGHAERYVKPVPAAVAFIPGEPWDALVTRLRPTFPAVDRALSDGVELEADAARGPGHFRLVTTNPQLAEAHGLNDESELLPP